ncbi:MAG: hypothetical protein CMH57_05930 [Myxococcales bacterium]|nr:hypothetical protein [Myxococcales bacterium]
MGFLDFLFSKEKAQERQLGKLRKTLTNMWVQSPERNYAAEQLRNIGTDDALMILMERFKHTAQNTTYDNEEKMYVYDLLVSMGPTVIDVVKRFIREEPEKINWPMKVLDDLLSGDEMASYIQSLLADMTIDYERNPEKKEQILIRARDFASHEGLQKEVARFSEDDNEGIRFIAVDAVSKQDADWAAQALRNNLRIEDSGRVLQIACEKLVETGWTAIDEEEDEQIRADILDNLPNTYLLTEEGALKHK